MSRIEELTFEELRRLIAGGESTKLEFKINPPRQYELSERICGMANTPSGGIILFGVEDSTGRLVGIADPGAITDEILRAARALKPPVKLLTSEPVVFKIDGKNIVAIEIPPNKGTLYQCATKGFVIRKGTNTIGMSIEEVQERLYTYGLMPWEKNVNPVAGMEDFDPALIERYLALRAERSRRNLRYHSREDLLVGLGCAGPDPQSGLLRPTNTGLLMFAYEPQLFVPQSEVVCIRYADQLGIAKYVDRKNPSGPLPEIIDQVESWLRLNIRVGAEIKGFKRNDLAEYPLEALREASVNAIVHRDYSLVGETVRIFMYSNRVEIHSPGLLLPGITLEDLRNMSAPSKPRNPVLAQFLRDIPGYMERVGSGIRLMINEMREAGLPNPEFVEQHEFVVIFYNGQELQTLEEVSPSKLNSRQLMGLKLVQERGSISNGEYCLATGTSDRTALRDLADLVEQGILVTKGNKRILRYYLP